ncbi:hypothetical protein LIER_22846 [Lithospermum erythrorhizon]|uniref:Uncharacterized protein n=1 Tax=Lithospermum erythrorhizon TaxID=34254 RepID=A0AAV3QV99_LITER
MFLVKDTFSDDVPHQFRLTIFFSQATEAPYAMSLQWAESARVNEEFEREKSSIGESIRRIREEKDSALAGKEKALRDEMTSFVVRRSWSLNTQSPKGS